MKPDKLRASRLAAGLTQAQMARKLRTTQGYVSLLERGLRRPSVSLARRLAKTLNLPPTAQPFRPDSRRLRGVSVEWAARRLAALRYPGFAYLGASQEPTNPEEVLLRTLATKRVEPRLAEALPWLLLCYSDFNQEELVALAYLNHVQNRLGFVVALAKNVAQNDPAYTDRLPELDRLLSALESLRLAKEDDLGQHFRTERLQAWVRENRSEEAVHWNMLTDFGVQQLAYVN